MALTTEQKAVLAADILADPVLSAYPNSPDNAAAIADVYNSVITPNFIIWRSRVPPSEILENGMVWSDLKNLSVGQTTIWSFLTSKGYINGAKLNDRLGLEEAFGKNSTTNVGIQPHLKGKATRLQKLFSTGTGTDALPATTQIEDRVIYQEIQSALGW